MLVKPDGKKAVRIDGWRVPKNKERTLLGASHQSRHRRVYHRLRCKRISSIPSGWYIIKAKPCISSHARRVHILRLPRYSPEAKIPTPCAWCASTIKPKGSHKSTKIFESYLLSIFFSIVIHDEVSILCILPQRLRYVLKVTSSITIVL